MSEIIKQNPTEYKANNDLINLQSGDKITIRIPGVGTYFDTQNKRNIRLMITIKKDI